MAFAISGQKESPEIWAKQTAIAAQAFWWIAGLSAVNTVSAWTGSSWRFVIGLGATDLLNAIGMRIGGAGTVVAAVVNLMICLGFVGLGFLAPKHRWAFVVGAVAFGLDGALVLVFREVLSALFHGFFLIQIFQGFVAAGKLVKMPMQAAVLQQPAVAAEPVAVVQQPAVPAGWYADPTGRHQYRWWDSAQWTTSVHNNGVTSVETV